MNLNLLRREPRFTLFISFILVACVAAGVWSIFRTADGSNDFDVFYAAGKAVLKKAPIYYTGQIEGRTLLETRFLYPPVAACFFSLLAWLPVSVAAFLWNVSGVLLFIISIVLGLQILEVPLERSVSYWQKISKPSRFLLSAAAIIMLIDNLAMAQVNILIFVLCLVSVLLWKKGKLFNAGLIIAAAIFFKITPILFCVFFACKKAWRLLFGAFVGSILLSLIIPTLIFGWQSNRIYHRQWLGISVKPLFIQVWEKIKKEDEGLLRKKSEDYTAARLGRLLSDTNQSLEAAAFRNFLKNRNEIAASLFNSSNNRVIAYEKLPVLGGAGEQTLKLIFYGFRFLSLILLVYLWTRESGTYNSMRAPVEISLIFLSITLLSPVTWSLYFVFWVFAFLTVWFIESEKSDMNKKPLILSAWAACLSYICLVFPYGEAIGMGAWANLIFWMGCVSYLITNKAAVLPTQLAASN